MALPYRGVSEKGVSAVTGVMDFLGPRLGTRIRRRPLHATTGGVGRSCVESRDVGGIECSAPPRESHKGSIRLRQVTADAASDPSGLPGLAGSRSVGPKRLNLLASSDLSDLTYLFSHERVFIDIPGPIDVGASGSRRYARRPVG